GGKRRGRRQHLDGAARPALGALRPALEKGAGGPVEIRYGATGTLAAALRKGAGTDLFVSGDEGTVRRLALDGVVAEGSISRCATGNLSLVAAKEGRLELPRRLDGATAFAVVKLPIRRLAVVSPKVAPEGLAAEDVLVAARIMGEMKEKLALLDSEDDAVATVLSGAADAAIVPSSLASAPGLKSCPVDPTLHEPLKLTAAVVSASTRKEAAWRALDVLSAPENRDTWKRFGFTGP
ncbi:MAG TPA: molybdate ABC transporter substrate-binding protein, partial [Thermoanaerobaculia bacterium]|nr:molybdate ABC transporter substrate-binding protein [Thermoanaerobaculia bacterium]